MLRIKSNGSKWAGQSPDSLGKLIEVLGEYALDRSISKFGGFISKSPKFSKEFYADLGSLPEQTVHFSGNFFALSHVFSIITDDVETIRILTKAIRKNTRRADYRSQKAS